jgi:hypothetical protein
LWLSGIRLTSTARTGVPEPLVPSPESLDESWHQVETT